ncbi:MAG TPA: hypothetical protein VKU42_06630 [Candidatus Angelobacter sp.]|nr:hypothetical protein [Candidatus Angelobacter sp.]
MHHRPVESRASVRSLLGFTLGTASALLAAGSIIYAGASGGFHHYAPPLIGLYRLGILVPLGGLASSLAGMLSRNPLRWHAPALSLSMLLLWLIWVSGE